MTRFCFKGNLVIWQISFCVKLLFLFDKIACEPGYAYSTLCSRWAMLLLGLRNCNLEEKICCICIKEIIYSGSIHLKMTKGICCKISGAMKKYLKSNCEKFIRSSLHHFEKKIIFDYSRKWWKGITTEIGITLYRILIQPWNFIETNPLVWWTWFPYSQWHCHIQM